MARRCIAGAAEEGLSTTAGGLWLEHPVMNVAGVLASSREGVARLVEAGVSCVVTKTLTLEPREGHRTPVVVPLPYGLLNSIGLANPGAQAAELLVEEAHSHGVPAAVSITGGSPGELASVAEIVLEAGADAIEVNLSCPNALGLGANVFRGSRRIREAVWAVASISTRPVWVKLGYSRMLTEEAGAALDAGARALVLINTIPGMAIDVYAGRPILSAGSGGLSGPAIHPVAVYSIYTVYREYRADIIGAGGVYDYETAAEMIMAGARAVQIATAFYTRGCSVVKEVVRGLKRLLHELGAGSIEEIVGCAHRS